MISLIKKILKETFESKQEEKFYQFVKSYMDKKYETFMSTKFAPYTNSLIFVYRFVPTIGDENYYDNSFDMKKDGSLFNNSATFKLKENLGFSSLREMEKFLLRYAKELERL